MLLLLLLLLMKMMIVLFVLLFYPRNFPLKFFQNRVSNTCNVVFVVVVVYGMFLFVVVDPTTLDLKFG